MSIFQLKGFSTVSLSVEKGICSKVEMGKSKRSKYLVASIFSILLLLVLFFGGKALVSCLTETPLRRALPATAKNIQEFYWEEQGDLGQDYSYRLSAKITEAEFFDYVNKLEMEPYDPDGRHKGLIDLWNPFNSNEGIYIITEDNCNTLARWENGLIFVASYCT